MCIRDRWHLGPALPGPAVRAHQAGFRRSVIAVDLTVLGFDGVEVDFAEQRQRMPSLPAVGGLHQSEQCWQVLPQVGMSAAEKTVRAGDREAHGVLVTVVESLKVGRFSEQLWAGSDQMSVISDADHLALARKGKAHSRSGSPRTGRRRPG